MADDPKTIKSGSPQGGRPKKNKWTSEILSEMEIDEIFTEIPKDYMIKVHRQEPEWCSGYLGTVHFDPERPFSIDKLKEQFGGGLFTLRIVDESHKYRGQKTIRIADVPKENYQEIDADFLTIGGAQRRAAGRSGDKGSGGGFGFPGFNMPGLPPDVQRRVMRWYLLGEEGESKKSEKANTTAELMQQKMMMEMMQAQSQHQMAMQRHQLEYERELEKMRKSRDPQEPLSDVQQTIALLRELNGMKSEFGGSENVATEIIGQTAPILETALTELIALQKLKVQGEIAKAKGNQPPPRPLPARATTARPAPRPSPPQQRQTGQDNTGGGHPVSPPPISQPVNGSGRNPLQIAKEMGEIYRRMDDAQQQALMMAFIGDSEETDVDDEEYIDDEQQTGNNNSDTVMSTTDTDTAADLLDPEDRAVLESEADETDEPAGDGESEYETGDVQDGIDTGTTEIDGPPDRASDPQGSALPPD